LPTRRKEAINKRKKEGSISQIPKRTYLTPGQAGKKKKKDVLLATGSGGRGQEIVGERGEKKKETREMMFRLKESDSTSKLPGEKNWFLTKEAVRKVVQRGDPRGMMEREESSDSISSMVGRGKRVRRE